MELMVDYWGMFFMVDIRQLFFTSEIENASH